SPTRPYFLFGRDRHRPLISPVIVGATSLARKGTSRQILEPFDMLAARGIYAPIARRKSGLSSGEGLIYEIRDPRVTGHDAAGQGKTDPGNADKRLFILESEFGRVLKVAAREGNILSDVIRQAWDGEHNSVMTKNSPDTASYPAVSILGHVTAY